ncbi:MAG: hypothetical protein R3C49_03115 [Planctomycetaceae bacterium]
MRIWHRFKTIVPLLLAISVATEGSAQDMSGYGSYGAPEFMGGPPQGYSATGYEGMPQSFQSYPMISPFDHAFEQHFSSDGLWFKRSIGAMTQMNDYYFNVDYVRTKSRTLRGNFGDSTVATFDQTAMLGGIPGSDNVRDIQVAFPDALFFRTFPQHDTGLLLGNDNQGIRLSGGLKNQTGWRFAWNVGYNGKTNNVFDARANLNRLRMSSVDAIFLDTTGGIVNAGLPNNLNGVNERQILETIVLARQPFDTANGQSFGYLGNTDDLLDRNLYPFGSIGIRTGDPTDPVDPRDPDGAVQLFDLDFILQHEVESYGAGFQVSSSPLYERGSLQIRPLLGGRMFRLNESIQFYGVDSHLSYDANVPNGLDDDDDFVIDNVDEDGSLNFTTDATDTDEQILVRSFVNSAVRSVMSGPEVGIEYEVAKRGGVTFSGSTRMGALVNVEKMYLTGDNIGNTFATDALGVKSHMFSTDPQSAESMDPANLHPGFTRNFFSDQNTSTHISPMFEQNLQAELPIFSRIPVLRNIWQLEHAKFRAGWTYTWIGEVANPTNSIVFISNPKAGLFPYLKTERSQYFQNQFNLGINWEF